MIGTVCNIQDDADDMASVSASAHDHDTLSTAGSRALAVPSPIRPVLPVSSHVDKVYTEKAGGGFINKRKGAANSIKLSRSENILNLLASEGPFSASVCKLQTVDVSLQQTRLSLEDHTESDFHHL